MKKGLGFSAASLSPEAVADIREKARKARGDILTMTTLAASGHPGGSMSSIDIYLTLYAVANVDSADPHGPGRDRIVVSHGHTSPAVYATLCASGFVARDAMIAGFRQAWSPFEGHIEREIPGVEWSTGNLGQGMSAGCGMALASRLTGHDFRVYVVMGDGEQQKGQIAEARRFAAKYGLTNLTAIIDYNQLQISGDIHQVMPQDLEAGWASDGWEVLTVDGHDIQALYGALRQSTSADKPVCIIANTVMGKGVPSMENQHKYHGAPIKGAQFSEAMEALGLQDELEYFRAKRPEVKAKTKAGQVPQIALEIETGTPRTYTLEEKTDNRSGWGNAISDLGALNSGKDGQAPLAVFDCDLAGSVKTSDFWKRFPDQFFQAGIQEHHTATMAGALSTQGVLTWWADFGVFATDETYNQQRLNDINHSSLKTICTHIGLDVGEDGKTHQGIDYIGLLRNVFGYKIVLPADPNETDRAVRWAATEPGNVFIGVGRSKLLVVTKADGSLAFGGDHRFEYGKAMVLREGGDIALLSTGTMTHRAVEAWQLLKETGIEALLIHIATPTAIDEDALKRAAETGHIVTYEDHHVNTGLGCSVAMAMVDRGISAKLTRLGVTHYQPSGSANQLFAQAGLDAVNVANRIRALLRSQS